MNRYLVAPIVLLSLLINGCGNDSAPANGRVNVFLTDAPACGFDHVFVTVERVRVHRSDDAAWSESGWHEVVLENPQKIDLLSLSNGVFLTLGQALLPAGRYQQIRLVLADDTGGGQLRNSVVPTGSAEQELATPSASRSGYKVIGDFTVQPDALVDLVLDFDACHSIVEKGNGGYALKPVVKATPLQVSGVIDGYVSPADAGARVYAEQNGVIVKGTVAEGSGRFILSPVIQSTSAGLYDIVIARDGDATTIVRGIPVAAGATTTISTSSAPFVLPSSAMNAVSGTVTPVLAGGVVSARQSSSGGTYAVAVTNSNLDTGAYSLNLPVAPPLVGDYTGNLPVPVSADPVSAGAYSLDASTNSGAAQSTFINLLSGDVSDINFLF